MEPTGYEHKLPLLSDHNSPHGHVAEQRGDLERERNPGFEFGKAVEGPAKHRPKSWLRDD